MSRFLLLSAAMGAGHDAATAELARRLRANGHACVEQDVLGLLPGVGAGVRGFYHLIIRRAPFVYSGIYSTFFQPGGGPRPGSTPLAALAEGRLLDAVGRARADAVVSLFHLAAQLTGRARARGRLAVPCAALITDFAVHRQWLNQGNDLNLCLTEPEARQARHALGRPCAVYGPMVPAAFRPHPVGAAAWRDRFEGGDPPVLLSAGAWGAGTGFTRTAVVLRDAGFHPVVLCGRDERLRRRLAQVPGATALGWVEDMPGLLGASAALLDNAAGQTALQALAVGLPVIGWRPIPGHGIAGVRRMSELGLSEYARDEAELLTALGLLVPPGPVRDERVAAGRALLEADGIAPLEAMVKEQSNPDGIGGRTRPGRGARGSAAHQATGSPGRALIRPRSARRSR